MAVKLDIWTPEKTSQELLKRLQASRKARQHLEYIWAECERVVYSTSFQGGFFNDEQERNFISDGSDSTEMGRRPSLNVSYCMKNFRFLHSQMSANPPTATAKPNSSDQEDKRSADAANRLINFGVRKYKFQNRQDIVNLHTLAYGTGFGKTMHDPNGGLPVEFDAEQDAVKFEGEFAYTQPHPRNMFLDPDAVSSDDVRWCIERIYMPVEMACIKYPVQSNRLKELAESIQGQTQSGTQGSSGGADSFFQFERFNRIPIFQYWETGTPENGLRGRFCPFLEDGTVLTEDGASMASPYVFPVYSDATGEAIGSYARLPYHILTDIDVPGTAWGMPVVAYAVQLQDLMNHLVNASADIVQAHGVARVLVHDSAELAEDALTNNNWDVLVYAGNREPKYMEPLPFPQALPMLMTQVKQYLDDIFGVTELNLGQQKRETSGNSMQFAIEQSNLVRKRLFNKLTLYVESVYQDYLALIAANWTTARTIKTIGREQAMEVMDIKGSDIKSGYDVIVEYGTQFSLDPITRRMEIMQMAPFFKEAGLTMRQILGMMKLSDLSSLYDATQLAEARQHEYFEQIIQTAQPVPPGRKEDHINMLAYALMWRMTAEFKELPMDIQDLCLQHIDEREKMAAEETKAPAAPPAAGTPDSGVAPAQNPLAALTGMV
jgi:hypothetical protein